MKNNANKQLLSLMLIAVLLTTFYSCKKSSNVSPAASQRSIGESYGGGIIAYILQLGDPGYDAGAIHGLIAAQTDLPVIARWYNNNYVVTGTVATALGSGSNNTGKIISKQGSAGSYAAKNCVDLALGGFNDWYLPSLDELNKLYLNKKIIGGFKDVFYWTSTEKDSNGAGYQNFYNGYQSVDDKSAAYNVRAVRSF